MTTEELQALLARALSVYTGQGEMQAALVTQAVDIMIVHHVNQLRKEMVDLFRVMGSTPNDS